MTKEAAGSIQGTYSTRILSYSPLWLRYREVEIKEFFPEGRPGWVYSSVIKCMPHRYKALDSIPALGGEWGSPGVGRGYSVDDRITE